MIKKILCLILFMCAVTSHAFPQKISVCLNIIKNTSPYNVKASFVSTDYLDRGSHLTLDKGTECIEHTYRFGPKYISLQLYMERTGVQTKIIADDSCNFVTQTRPAWFTAEKIKTMHPTEMWSFHLNQISARDGYDFVYNMVCHHITS